MLIALPSHLGYGALAALIFGESAGFPLPGETALVAAALLAGSGHLSLPIVVAIAAAAAMLGDNLGYWLGRRFGRDVIVRGPGWLSRHSAGAVKRSEAFFARHGGKAVFLGRWVTGVRVAVAVVAGAAEMPWRRFLVFNALGALTWSASIATAVALIGAAAAAAVFATGMAIVIVALAVAGVGLWLGRKDAKALSHEA